MTQTQTQPQPFLPGLGSVDRLQAEHADQGGPIDPIAFLEAVAEELGSTLYAEQRRYIEGPLVLPNGTWADVTPTWIRKAVPGARIQQVLLELAGEETERLATLEEVVAYFHIASLEAPLDSDAARCYFWAGARVLSRHGLIQSPGEFWDLLELGEHERELTEYVRTEVLQRLRRDIRRAVSRRR